MIQEKQKMYLLEVMGWMESVDLLGPHLLVEEAPLEVKVALYQKNINK
jgi:hypothetical protein